MLVTMHMESWVGEPNLFVATITDLVKCMTIGLKMRN